MKPSEHLRRSASRARQTAETLTKEAVKATTDLRELTDAITAYNSEADACEGAALALEKEFK